MCQLSYAPHWVDRHAVAALFSVHDEIGQVVVAVVMTRSTELVKMTTILIRLLIGLMAFWVVCDAHDVNKEDDLRAELRSPTQSGGLAGSVRNTLLSSSWNSETSLQHPHLLRGIQSSLKMGQEELNPAVIVASDESSLDELSSIGRAEGVQVSRSITRLMPDAAVFINVKQDLDNNVKDPCTGHDVYGSNDCHLEWSSVVTVNYTVQVNSTIDEGDTLEGHFTLDRFLPWKFSCPLCGKDCELQFPILPLNYTIVMPPCPVPPHSVTHTLEHHLWEHSPTKGLVTTHLEGTVHLIRGSTQESIAEFGVSVTVR